MTQQQEIQTDVLIVGAGPVGMALALTLRRAGTHVTIVDKAPKTRQHSQAAVLWPRTLEVLDLLGVVGDWDGHTVPIHGMSMTVDGVTGALDLKPVNGAHPQPVGVGQDVTEALLDARLKASGADYRRGVEVADLHIAEGGATATLHSEGGDTRAVRAAWVVGCEGSHSLVRDAAGITQVGDKNAGVQLLQGDVRIGGPFTLAPGTGHLWAALAPGTGHLWAAQDGMALLVIPAHVDGHDRLLVTLPDDGAQGEPTLEQLQDLARRIVPGLTLSDPSWLNRYRTQHRIATQYRRGRALVAGDAAHVWVPIGGQGMNIGMQDAFDLGWKLAGVVQGTLPEDALDTYDAERRPIGEQNIADTERLYGALLAPHGLGDVALRAALPRALGLPGVSALVAAHFGQMDFHYGPSRLVRDGGGHGPAAGTRAPDAYVSRDGATVRMLDLYRAGHWVVLGWATRDGDRAAQEALAGLAFGDVLLVDATPGGADAWDGPRLRDIPHLAASAYGAQGPCVHVIRPDGVIGYRGPADRAALDAYLHGVAS